MTWNSSYTGYSGGANIDLVTEKFLNRRIRERVLAEAEVQYADGLPHMREKKA